MLSFPEAGTPGSTWLTGHCRERRTVALGDGGRILVTADVEAGGRAALLLGLCPLEASDDVDATLPDAISLASVPIAAVDDSEDEDEQALVQAQAQARRPPSMQWGWLRRGWLHHGCQRPRGLGERAVELSSVAMQWLQRMSACSTPDLDRGLAHRGWPSCEVTFPLVSSTTAALETEKMTDLAPRPHMQQKGGSSARTGQRRRWWTRWRTW